MNQTTQTQTNLVAKEIFKQLSASKVNGFPFFAYSGIKPSIFSETALYLKLPKNPSKFKSILVTLNQVRDTYDVNFYTHDNPLIADDKHTDIYGDCLVELIIRKMGIN
ncbi:MAG: hypothetical protein HRU07_06825 [Nitrosopumilus sp.]|nr:hypothetical protein [Nitrosopumilus sp.]NRA05852.1 hypothetical protein [Nitrosopumilus sp.]